MTDLAIGDIKKLILIHLNTSRLKYFFFCNFKFFYTPYFAVAQKMNLQNFHQGKSILVHWDRRRSNLGKQEHLASLVFGKLILPFPSTE